MGQQRQPLVALAEHVGDGVLGGLHVHIQVFQQDADFLEIVGQIQRGAGRGLVVRARVVGDLRHAAQLGQPGHAAHQAGAERVDGADGQPRRVLQQMPAQLVVARQRVVRQFPAAALVHGLGHGLQAAPQLAQHARVHFRGGLAREGDGHDFLGPVHRGQQRQDAIGQQLGLAGSRRRLHQERARRVQRLGARGVVVGQAFLFRHLGVLVVRCSRRNGKASQYFRSSRR